MSAMQRRISIIFSLQPISSKYSIIIIIIIIKSKGIFLSLIQSPPLVVSRCLLWRRTNTRLIYQRLLETIRFLSWGRELLEGSSWVETIFPSSSIESFEGRRRREERKAGRKRDVATAKTRFDSWKSLRKS